MSRQPASGTVPLVEPDGFGGHVPYVRVDNTPTTTYAPADAAILAELQDMHEILREIRDECRAARLAVQERVNEGNATQHDFLELALSMRDSTEEM